jgi:hypothetical protein
MRARLHRRVVSIAQHPEWDAVTPIIGVVGAGNVYIFDHGDGLGPFAGMPEFICDPNDRWRHVESGTVFVDEDAALAFAASINDKRGGRIGAS